MIDKLEAAAQKRELLQKAAKQAEDDLISAQQSREESSEDLLRWRHEWSVALDLLGLPGDSSPTEANVVLDKIEELFKKVDSLSSLETRIAGILRDGEDFQNDVTALVERVAPDLESLPPEQSVPELNKRLQAAQKDSAAFNELKEQQKEREETIQKAHRIIHNCELKLKELCRTANCLEFDELIEVEERSSKAQTIMAGIESLDKQLLEYSGGSSIEAVIAEAEEADADALPAQIMSLTTRIEEMAAKRSELIEEIGREKTKLALMDGSSTSAEAAERTQSTLAEIRDYANRYIRLRLASTILHREIERYRSENQDPMLRRSSEIFAQLCLGSFVGLQADFNELDEPILLGVRGNGKRVTVQGMSEGTRDQLYLALRLASLEKYLEHNEAMPLIVDDILINFDDERAKATLQVLADLSRKTQVIFFTHHIHLVELAKACTLPCHVISLGN